MPPSPRSVHKNGAAPTLVIAGKAGQLGNRLFYSSHIMTLAGACGGSVINCSLGEYAPLFEKTARDLLCAWPTPSRWRGRAPGWLREIAFRMVRRADWLLYRLGGLGTFARVYRMGMEGDERWSVENGELLADLRRGGFVFVSGWVALHHLRLTGNEEIRQYFQPILRHREAIASLMTQARAEADVLVGFHIRQGDYTDFLEGRYAYPSDHYWTSMLKVAALFPGRRVAFLLCSNERQKAPDGFPHSVTFGTGVVIEDMYALAACDYLCGPPSTFSLWASFYGRKPLWQMRTIAEVPTMDSFAIFQ